MECLTEKQSYAAMILFLRRYSDNTKGDGNVTALLSGMRLATDGERFETFDPGYWYEWMEDIQTVLTASETPEKWLEFEEECLVYRVTAPDGTELVARIGKEPDRID